jgi:hypothetical protein
LAYPSGRPAPGPPGRGAMPIWTGAPFPGG